MGTSYTIRLAPKRGSNLNAKLIKSKIDSTLESINDQMSTYVINSDISLLNKFVGEQYMSNTESDFSRLDSYTTADLSIKYKFDKTSLFSDIVVTAMINNIFNVEYVSNGYYYTYDDTWSDPNLITTIEGTGYYPQATRNFLLGITLKL